MRAILLLFTTAILSISFVSAQTCDLGRYSLISVSTAGTATTANDVCESCATSFMKTEAGESSCSYVGYQRVDNTRARNTVAHSVLGVASVKAYLFGSKGRDSFKPTDLTGSLGGKGGLVVVNIDLSSSALTQLFVQLGPAPDVRSAINTGRMCVAGEGGWGSSYKANSGSIGGGGGGLTGLPGASADYNLNTYIGGAGGSQTAGGSSSNQPSLPGANGGVGSDYLGGMGYNPTAVGAGVATQGGRGGDGFFGGAGGAQCAGGGGGSNAATLPVAAGDTHSVTSVSSGQNIHNSPISAVYFIATSCKTNFFLYRGVCYVSCPVGTYQTPTSCVACNPGYSTPAAGTVGTDSKVCTICAPGYAFIATTAAAPSQCVDCVPGKYKLLGNTACLNCPAGSFSGARAAICTPCRAGQFSSAGSCALCTAGKFSTLGDTTCSDCAAGEYSNNGASVCEVCAAGYSSAVGSSSCAICAAGKSAIAGATSCTPCASGTFSTAGARVCSPCGAGLSSSVGASACTPAPVEEEEQGSLVSGLSTAAKFGVGCGAGLLVCMCCIAVYIFFGDRKPRSERKEYAEEEQAGDLKPRSERKEYAEEEQAGDLRGNKQASAEFDYDTTRSSMAALTLDDDYSAPRESEHRIDNPMIQKQRKISLPELDPQSAPPPVPEGAWEPPSIPADPNSPLSLTYAPLPRPQQQPLSSPQVPREPPVAPVRPPIPKAPPALTRGGPQPGNRGPQRPAFAPPVRPLPPKAPIKPVVKQTPLPVPQKPSSSYGEHGNL